MEKYVRVGQATDGNIIRRMRIACWITKVTDTHSEYVTLTAFPRQMWLRERASMLRYTHIACLVLILFSHTHYFFFQNFRLKMFLHKKYSIHMCYFPLHLVLPVQRISLSHLFFYLTTHPFSKVGQTAKNRPNLQSVPQFMLFLYGFQVLVRSLKATTSFTMIPVIAMVSNTTEIPATDIVSRLQFPSKAHMFQCGAPLPLRQLEMVWDTGVLARSCLRLVDSGGFRGGYSYVINNCADKWSTNCRGY
jgi:hypothetical protein